MEKTPPPKATPTPQDPYTGIPFPPGELTEPEKAAFAKLWKANTKVGQNYVLRAQMAGQVNVIEHGILIQLMLMQLEVIATLLTKQGVLSKEAFWLACAEAQTSTLDGVQKQSLIVTNESTKKQ